MPTYVYETTDAKPVRQFEIRQSMNDAPLKTDPESGRPVHRVITGGAGILTGGATAPAKSGGGCGSGCGCHH